MSTARITKVSAACPVFDGTEYPYWKNKMRMHLEAIDVDLWYVVENGVPKAGEGVMQLGKALGLDAEDDARFRGDGAHLGKVFGVRAVEDGLKEDPIIIPDRWVDISREICEDDN